MLRFGLDVVTQRCPSWLRGLSVGLITNHTGLNTTLESNVDLFSRMPEIKLRALFAPEHGLQGVVPAGEKVTQSVHSPTGLPVHSLYSDAQGRPALDPEVLQGIDALVFDIADIGCRYYTYPYSMARCMQIAREHQLLLVVLDRPNPLGGLRVAGNVLEPDHSSFVGMYPIPIQHGMTIGELAVLFNTHFGIGCQLKVVPMEGWRRSMGWEENGLPWVMPSPNIPTVETARFYPGTCLFEGTTLSEGRGTTKPFQLIGAPWIDASQCATFLNGKTLPGVIFRPVHFIPWYSKHAGSLCQGVEAHITGAGFDPIRSTLYMLQSCLELFPEHPLWEPEATRPFFDLLAGSFDLRKQLLSGHSPDLIMADWLSDLHRFKAIRETCLLY